MNPTARSKRAVLAATAVASLFLIAIFNFGPGSKAETGAPALNPITVTKSSVLVPAGDGNADPGETIEHTIVIGNGGTPATNVQLTDVLQSITTLSGSVAVSPIAVNDTYTALGNVRITVPDGVTDVLANDTNPGGAGSLTIVAPLPTTSANGGNVALNADGSFTYNPPAGFEGADSFTYTLSNGSGLTDTATVEVTVSGMIWFVQNGAAACTLRANGCGRLTNPYSSLGAFQAENNGAGVPAGTNPSANDNIFLYENAAAYTGGITLLAGQKLIGQDAAATLATVAGVTVPTGSDPLPAMNPGGAATLVQNGAGNGVTLGSSNVLRGFTASNSSGFAILGSSFGTVTVTDVIMNTTGAGLSLTTGTFAGSGFTSFTSSSGASNVTLTGVAGTVPLGTGAMSGATNNAFNVSGGTAAITYSGNINHASAGFAAVSVSGGHTTGTITFSTGTINAIGGTGLQFDNADSTYSFNGTNTMNGGDAGIDILNGSGGTFSFSANTSINRANSVAGAAFNLTSSNANVTYSGSMTLGTSTGNMVNIDNHDAGTITFQTGSLSKGVAAGANATQAISISNSNAGTIHFNNPTVAIIMSTGNAVSLTGNTGGTMNFTPAAGGNGLDITTTSGIGFNATGGGTVVVTGSGNTIGTGTGTALNVDNTTIGASGFTFLSISANGAPNGIVLNTTGAGFFTVTGTATTDGTGGTIQNITNRGASFISTGTVTLSNIAFTNAGTTNGADPTSAASGCGDLGPVSGGNLSCNAAIHLQSLSGPTLTNVDIIGGLQVGINGNNVTNFTLANSIVQNAGDQVREDGLKFRNMLGTSSITNSTISGNEAVQLHVENISGVLTSLAVTNTTISTSAAPNGSHGILFDTHSTATGKLVVQGVTFSNLFSNCIDALSESSSGGMDIVINGDPTAAALRNSFTGCGASGITIAQNGAAPLRFNIFNNGTLASPTFLGGTSSSAININQAGSAPQSAVMQGAITGNFIGGAGATSSTVGGDGITAATVAPGTLTVAINNNRVRGTGANGIRVQMREETNTAQRLNLTLLSNDVLVTNSPNGFDGIHIQAGTLAGDAGTMCAEINNNDGGTIAAGTDFLVRNRFVTTFQLRGYVGANNNNVAVQTYLDVSQANDPTGPGTDWFITNNVATGGGGFINTPGGAQCTQPTLPASAPFAEENGNLLGGNSDNDVSFLGHHDENPAEILASLYPVATAALLLSSEATGSDDQAQPHAVRVTNNGDTGFSNHEVAATPAENATVRVQDLPASNLDSLDDLATLASEMVCAIGEMISPTVYSQGITPSSRRSVTPNKADRSAPEGIADVSVGPLSIPANESVTVRFNVTVNNGPYDSGVNNITNTATVTADGGVNMNSNTTSIPLAAAPDLQVTVSDGNTTTQPGAVVQYATTYQNNTANNGQNAAAVRITQTVPTNTTFNATVSGAGWSCPNGSVAGTVCTFDVGAVNAGAAPAALNFAVNVLAALPAGAIQISDTATIAENPLNTNGTDRVPGNNSSNDTTNIIGNWLGTTSTAWETASNWSNGALPPSGNSISVPDVANPPTLASSRTVNLLTLNDNLSIGDGFTLTSNGNVSLGTSSVLIPSVPPGQTGTGTLELGTASAITRTTGQVNTTLKKNFAAGPLPMFEMPVGTTGASSPLFVTVTSGSGQLTVKANTGVPVTVPPLDATKVLQRYWTLSGGGITSNLTFQYLQTDVPGTTSESLWNVIRVTGNTSVRYPPGPDIILNNAANTFTVNNVSVYSHWTAGEPLAPTAANANVSGRVTDTSGRGVYGARISMQDQAGNVVYAITNPFGYYQFTGVQAGQSYLMNAVHKRFEFQPRTITVSDDLVGIDFIALEPGQRRQPSP